MAGNGEAWFVNVCTAKVPEFENSVTTTEIKQAQDNDDVIQQVKEWLNTPEKDVKNLDQKVKDLLHHRKKLMLDDRGILIRKVGSYKQIVWPESLRHVVYQWFHSDS